MDTRKGVLTKDYIGGSLLALVGFGAVLEASRYPIGSLSSMGPGYYPIALGVSLIGVGLMVLLKARFSAASSSSSSSHVSVSFDWRGWTAIVLSVIAFSIVGKYFGLIPAIFAIVFISALGDRRNSLKSATFLALCMIVFGVAVFSFGLKIPFDLFGGR
jgi:putative tricarboxylic transport membrane protein